MPKKGREEFLPVPYSPQAPAGGIAPSDGFMLPDSGDDEESGGIDVARYVAALLRFKWVIAGLALTGLLLGFAASRFVKPVYEAQATIQIPNVRRDQTASPIQTQRLFEVRGWVEIVRSFAVLDEVVRKRRLFIRPAQPADSVHFVDFGLADSFTPGQYVLASSADGSGLTLSRQDGTPIEAVTAGDSIGHAVGFRWAPSNVRPGAAIAFNVIPPRDAAVALNRDLQIIPPPQDGSLLRMQLRGTDPIAIAGTLNAVTERFVELATQLKREDLTTRTEVLRAQLARSQAELTAADNALEGYRVRTITQPSDRGASAITPGLQQTRDPVFDAFYRLRVEKEALQNDRDAITRALRLPSDSVDGMIVALGTIPSVREVTELIQAFTEFGVRRAEVRRMSAIFTSEHPPLRQLEAEVAALERDVIRRQAEAVVANLQRRIGDLDQRLSVSSIELERIPPRMSEEARRRRDFESAQDIHSALRSAFEQARLSELSAAPDVRALDMAVPPTTPVVDRILFIIVGGLAGGLGLGILLALAFDHFDGRIRYPVQVTRDLGLSVLGALPLVRTDRQGRLDPETVAHLRESLRSIRMGMTYAHGTAGAFITTITSAGPGEGKSFLSSNLAKSFADSGHRTLLIDGDIRRGLLHRTLGVPRRPGLLDYLSGTASLEQVVRSLPAQGIDFISCGTRLAGGPELLASAAMAQMLMGLRSKYSVIIVDSPPLGAGVDPLVLASLCGSMVMVLRNGITDRDLAEAKLGDLSRLPIRVLGAVLNDVKPEGVYRYYSYLPGYRAEDEDGKASEPVVLGGIGPGTRR